MTSTPDQQPPGAPRTENSSEPRRFESWADYNQAAGEEFRYDTERAPWPVEYEAAGGGIENDLTGRPDPLRILFLPHGFALDSSRDGDTGNVVACGWVWQPPVTLLAERVPFAVAKQLLVTRPGTLTGVIGVLRGRAGRA